MLVGVNDWCRKTVGKILKSPFWRKKGDFKLSSVVYIQYKKSLLANSQAFREEENGGHIWF